MQNNKWGVPQSVRNLTFVEFLLIAVLRELELKGGEEGMVAPLVDYAAETFDTWKELRTATS